MKFLIGAFCLGLLALPVAASAQDGPSAGGAAGDSAAASSSQMPVWPWVAGGLVATAIGVGVAASGGGGHGGSTTTTTTTTTTGG
jgi:hypothetical protein